MAYKDERTAEPLINVLEDKDEDIEVRKEAVYSLGENGAERARKALNKALDDWD